MSAASAAPSAAAGGARPLRLAILARSLDYGGAERQLVVLARGLHRRGHRVVVAVLYPNGPLERPLREAGVPVHHFAKRGRWDAVGFGASLLRFLREERPGIVHGYLPFQNLLALLARPLGARVVWGIRNSGLEASAHDALGRGLDAAEGRLGRLADLVISNSWAGRDDAVARGVPAAKVVVVPNGIDTERFRPDPAAGRRFREAIGVAPAAPLVGLVGRLAPQKDHPTFLRAAAALMAGRPAARFVCVGAGPAPYAADLARLADDLGLGGRLVWAGARDDAPAVHNALDVAVSASAFGEGFANVVGEAMACGVPCVVTDVGDSARVVGDLGAVVPPRDPAALAAAVGGALDAVAAGRIDRATLRERVVSRFSEDRLIEETERLLRALPAPGRRR